ncbi:MAG: M56 family metallopeptidase [Planctomycetota bacterium]
MNSPFQSIYPLIDPAIVEAVGWCLVHSLWQITAIAIVVRIASAFLHSNRANLRYTIGMAGLVASVVVTIVTWSMVYAPGQEQVSAVEQYNTTPVIRHIDHPNAALNLNGETQGASFDGLTTGILNEPSVYVSVTDSVTAKIRPWLPGISAVWLLGMICFSFRPLLGLWTIRRLKTLGTTSVSEAVQVQFNDLMNRMSVSRSVQIMQSTRAVVPMVAGFVRPLVLIPASSLTNLSASELEAVIAHELAHLKRYDDVVNLFQTAIETLFFFHPGIWWISALVRNERENCCDDIAVAATGNPRHLAGALLNLEQSRTIQPAISANGGSLVKRIRRLVYRDSIKRRRFPLSAIAASLAGLSVAAALVFVATSSNAVGSNADISLQNAASQEIESGSHADERLPADDADNLLRTLSDIYQANGPTTTSDSTGNFPSPIRIDSVRAELDESRRGVTISFDEDSIEIVKRLVEEITLHRDAGLSSEGDIDLSNIKLDIHDQPNGVLIVAENADYMRFAERLVHDLMAESVAAQEDETDPTSDGDSQTVSFGHTLHLQHVRADQIAGSVAELYDMFRHEAGNANIVADTDSNTFVVSGSDRAVDAVRRIISALDRPAIGQNSPPATSARSQPTDNSARIARIDARMELMQAEQNLQMARTSYEHSRQLYERGFVTAEQMQSDELDVRQAELSLIRAREIMEVYDPADPETSASPPAAESDSNDPRIYAHATTELQLFVGQRHTDMSEQQAKEIVVKGVNIVRVDAVSNQMRFTAEQSGIAEIELRNADGNVFHVYRIEVVDDASSEDNFSSGETTSEEDLDNGESENESTIR